MTSSRLGVTCGGERGGARHASRRVRRPLRSEPIPASDAASANRESMSRAPSPDPIEAVCVPITVTGIEVRHPRPGVIRWSRRRLIAPARLTESNWSMGPHSVVSSLLQERST